MIDLNVTFQIAGAALGHADLGQGVENGLRPLVQRDDVEHRNYGRTHHQSCGEELHERREKGQKLAGGKGLRRRLGHQVGVVIEDAHQAHNGKNGNEHREVIGKAAGPKGALLLLRELPSPGSERPVFRPCHAKLGNSNHELQDQTGNAPAKLEDLPLILDLEKADGDRNEECDRDQPAGQKGEPPAVVEKQKQAENRKDARKNRSKRRTGKSPPDLNDPQAAHGEIARAVLAEERNRQAEQAVPNRGLNSRVHFAFKPQGGKAASQGEHRGRDRSDQQKQGHHDQLVPFGARDQRVEDDAGGIRSDNP